MSKTTNSLYFAKLKLLPLALQQTLYRTALWMTLAAFLMVSVVSY